MYIGQLANVIQFTLLNLATKVGVVKEVEKTTDRGEHCYPIFQNVVAEHIYRHKQYFSSDKDDWKPGNLVEIKYNPNNPERMFTEKEITVQKDTAKFELTAMGLVGVFLLSGAYFVFQ